MPVFNPRRFWLASLVLGLWAAVVLAASLLRALETQDAAHAAATAQIARGRLSALVDREVGLVLAMAEAPTLKAWTAGETSAAHRAAALETLDRFRERFQSREAFLAHEPSGNFYFLTGASTPSDLAPKYTLQKDKPADEWFFSPAFATKTFKLNVDQDRELKVTRLWINAVIRDKDRKVGVTGTGFDLDTFLDAFYGQSPQEDTVLLMSPSGGLQLHPNRRYTLISARMGGEQGRITLHELIRDFDARARLDSLLRSVRTNPSQVATIKIPLENRTVQAGITYLQDLDWFLIALCHPTPRRGPLGLALGVLAGGWILFTGLTAWALRQGI